MWKYRTITPLGKIQVINSLVSTLVVYKMLCLPNPTIAFMSEYMEIISHFLWGKSNKFRYDRVIQNYEHGGLKLVDLESKNAALKLSWVLKSF